MRIWAIENEGEVVDVFLKEEEAQKVFEETVKEIREELDG